MSEAEGSEAEGSDAEGSKARGEHESETLDLRGLLCPEPVLKTRALLDNSAVIELTAIVDSEVNVNNLQRLARSLKISFDSRFENGSFKVLLRRAGGKQASEPESRSAARHAGEHSQLSPTGDSTTGTKAGAVILINKESFGEGDKEFSAHLLNIFLQTAYQSGQRPQAILLANSGVKLMSRTSASYEVLQEFKAAGCEVLACGLCVEYYGLTEEVPKEQITNMFAISEYLFSAERVIVP